MELIKPFVFTLAIISVGSALCMVTGGESMTYMFLAAFMAIVANDIIDSINDEIRRD